MSEVVMESIWVAVRVQRGFISKIRAYEDEQSARRKEKAWRSQNNPDYDETAVAKVSKFKRHAQL